MMDMDSGKIIILEVKELLKVDTKIGNRILGMKLSLVFFISPAFDHKIWKSWGFFS